MPLQINTHNFDIPIDLKQYVEDIVVKALKGIPAIDPQVEIKQNTHHRKGAIFSIVVSVPLPRKLIRAEVKDVFDIRAGIHIVNEKLERQIEKYKNK